MPDPDISSDQYELSYGDPELKNYLMHIDPELEYFDKNVGFYHEAVKVMLQDIKKLYPTLKNLLPHKHNFVKRRESYNQAADLFICEIQSLNEKDIKDLSLYYKEVALILDRLIQQN